MQTTMVKYLEIPVVQQKDHVVGLIALNRDKAANALHPEMIEALTHHFEMAKDSTSKTLRAIILKGNGKHFCAGADLEWMQQAKNLSSAENIADARRLSRLFQAIAEAPCPTIAVSHGSAFGGAVGLIAACDIAIARPDAVFCLSEVRLGIGPCVIMPYLSQKMNFGSLRRLALTGERFTAAKALQAGLIDDITDHPTQSLTTILNHLLASAPKAQKAIKHLHNQIIETPGERHEICVKAIAALRAEAEAKAGFEAFFGHTKTEPFWVGKMPENWEQEYHL